MIHICAYAHPEGPVGVPSAHTRIMTGYPRKLVVLTTSEPGSIRGESAI